MANIFKKIKTIDTVGDAPRKAKSVGADSQDSVRLGLKPVLKTGSDDMVDATDFQDPFGHDDESDLAIPVIKIKTESDVDAGNGANADDGATDDDTVNDDADCLDEIGPAADENSAPTSPPADDMDMAPSPSTDSPPIEEDKMEEGKTEEHKAEQALEKSSPAPDPLETDKAVSKPQSPEPKEDKPNFLIKAIDVPKAPLITAALDVGPKTKLHLHPVHETLTPHKTDSAAETSRPEADIETAAAQRADNIAPIEPLPAFISKPQARTVNIPNYDPPQWPYWALGGFACLWLIGSAAAAYGYFELGLTPLTAKPIHALGFIGFVMVPACLLGLSALLLRRLNSLSLVSQEMAFLNQKLLSPADDAGQSAATLADEITRQMDRIEQRADQAFHRLTQVQSAFADQIETISQTLTRSAQEQTALDNQLRSSKAAWTGSVKETDQSLSALSDTLDRVFESFQSRVATTQEKMTQLSSGLDINAAALNETLEAQSEAVDAKLTPIIETAERLQDKLKAQLSTQEDILGRLATDTRAELQELDGLLDEHAKKLNQLSTDQAALASGKDALNAAWTEDETAAQERLFRHISQIDALNDRTDALIRKIDKAAERLTTATQKAKASPATSHAPKPALRGSLNEDQLSLLPGLGEAKNMLPSLLTPEDDSEAMVLSYEDIDSSEMGETLDRPAPPEIPQSLSSQRVFGGQQPPPKANWFKRFGRRASDPIMPESQAGPLSVEPHSPLDIQIDRATLRDKLIALQLSPDALIDSGSVQAAAQLRLKDGPFAMSRYMSTHLGGAIDYLRGQLPEDPVLRRQVYDMAGSFPLREQLDEKDEDGLIQIFETEAGREYLLCDAALNG